MWTEHWSGSMSVGGRVFLLSVALLLAASAGPVRAQELPDAYRVRAVAFVGVSGEAVTKEDLLSAQVALKPPTEPGEPWTAPVAGEPVERIALFEIGGPEGERLLAGSAIQALAAAVVQTYNDAGYAAVRVTVPRSALVLLAADDSDGFLRIHVTEGIVGALRTTVVRPDGRDAEPRRSHARIAERSPLAEGERVQIHEAEDYLAWVTRHPRRHAALMLAPGERPGEVDLEYRITEEKPLAGYVSLSNTGTRQTSRWRQRFGAAHYDLTGADDLLSVDYMTAGFDKVHSLNLSYERPIESLERTRWRLYLSGNRYRASDIGVFDMTFKGAGAAVGAELTRNILQRGRFFVAAVGGAQYRRYRVEDDLFDVTTRNQFLMPYAGLRASSRTPTGSAFNASLMGEFNLRSLAGTSRSRMDGLGRMDADPTWAALRGDVRKSFYLEPLLDGNWGDPEHHSTLAHELMGSLRGQYVPGSKRLAPNFTHTAGGFYSVRGYPEAIVAGDHALIGTAEYRFHLPRALSPDPEAGTLFGRPFRARPQHSLGQTDWDLILRAFFDAGRVLHNERQSYESHTSLAGTGLGAELVLWRNLSLRADWGVALKSVRTGTQSVSSGDSRGHLSLTLFF